MLKSDVVYTIMCNGTYHVYTRMNAIEAACDICRIYPDKPVMVQFSAGSIHGYLNPQREGDTLIFENASTPVDWQTVSPLHP